MHPDDRSRVDAVVHQSLDPRGAGGYDIEYRIVQSSGAVRWVAAKGKAYFENFGGVLKASRFLGTLLDRTDQKRTQELLIESEKLALTGRLTASIAHEIRNPLDAIGNLLCLLRSEPSEEVRNQYLDLAISELDRASTISSKTLGLFRSPVASAKVDLADLVESTLILFHGRIAVQQVEVLRNVPKDSWIEGAEGELRQVVVNLVGNALDAMPKGGRLAFRSRRTSFVSGAGSGISFVIADDGEGMTPIVKSRIFEAFYTTKAAAGNGIGLWLSLEIVKKYDAKMRVRSAPGRGTVFMIIFPQYNTK